MVRHKATRSDGCKYDHILDQVLSRSDRFVRHMVSLGHNSLADCDIVTWELQVTFRLYRVPVNLLINS